MDWDLAWANILSQFSDFAFNIVQQENTLQDSQELSPATEVCLSPCFIPNIVVVVYYPEAAPEY